MIIKVLIGLAIALTFFFIAKRAQPIADRSGTSLPDPPSLLSSEQSPLLKVATFNIQTGKTNDGVRNIHGAAELIQDQHLIGIQEIYAPGWINKLGLTNFSQSQLNALIAGTAFGGLFSATRRRWFREQRGNAILSRLPISKWQIIALPDCSGKSFRNMTVIEFEWQNTPITFINTHLHTGKGREEQLDKVLAEFAKHPIAILVGDFNSRRDTQALTDALLDQQIDDAITSAQIDTHDPVQRIDWILTKGFTAQSGKAIGKGISDHPYYEVSLNLINRHNVN